MKKAILFFFLLLFFCNGNIAAQQDTSWHKPAKEYRLWVTLKDDMGFYSGYLYGVTNDNLALKSQIDSRESDRVIPYEYLDEVRYRNKNSYKKGMIWGVSIGATIGGIIGASQYDDEANNSFVGESLLGPLSGVVIGGLVGLGTGLVLGNLKSKNKIQGDQIAFWTFGKSVLD